MTCERSMKNNEMLYKVLVHETKLGKIGGTRRILADKIIKLRELFGGSVDYL